jgi:hypothetical protein
MYGPTSCSGFPRNNDGLVLLFTDHASKSIVKSRQNMIISTDKHLRRQQTDGVLVHRDVSRYRLNQVRVLNEKVKSCPVQRPRNIMAHGQTD